MNILCILYTLSVGPQIVNNNSLLLLVVYEGAYFSPSFATVAFHIFKVFCQRDK